ncbi:hypothetical protein UF75_2326 [Desulfosporosinus sp. I2]|nr:hypothetical protein UF75_2326 [Desulfosporosinus sp. I2]
MKRGEICYYIYSVFYSIMPWLILFINVHPSFGGSTTKKAKEIYLSLNNYVAGKF